MLQQAVVALERVLVVVPSRLASLPMAVAVSVAVVAAATVRML